MRSYKEQTEKILELAEQKKNAREKRNHIIVTLSSFAACALIALFCTSLFSGENQKTTLPVQSKTIIRQTTSVSTVKSAKTKTSKTTDNKNTKTTTHPKSTKSIKKTTTKKHDEIVIIPTKPTKSKSTIPDKYLSNKDLIENDSDVILYNGKSYVKTCSLVETEISKTNLLCDYIGKTSGKIDNTATDEITSNVNGKVYTINGYSDSFRLGMVTKDKSKGENYIYIFDNLYSLENTVVSNGSELFNNVLHIDKNLSYINYFSGTNLKIASLNQSNITTKISEKYQKPFIDSLNNAVLIKDDESVFDNEDKKVVLFFNMIDETTVEIYLTKNGYIFCDGLYFKTDSNIFSEVYYSLTTE